MKNNGLDEAKKLLDEFIKYNEGIDTAYVLEIMYLRCAKEYDKAVALGNEALEEYASAPEISRQIALVHLLQGDYDKAYEAVFNAYSNAVYIAQYYQDDSSLTTQLYNTLYLCAYLESEKGSMKTENSSEISKILDDLKDFMKTESVNDIINGKKTVEQVLTEGEFDLI
jgi:tetratricopeptide (TPR) repeat protein